MSLPAGPRTSWRPVVERSLALFNAAAVVFLVVWWATYQGSSSDYKADEARILSGAAGGGAVGFLGWFWYPFRLRLILVSGVFWTGIGALVLVYGLSPYPYVVRLFGHGYPVTMGGFVLVAVGVASVATFLRRDRSRYSRGARGERGAARGVE